MLKKTIKFVDYNGDEREEDFYFNFTEAELSELELSVQGGLKQKIETIVKSKDMPEIIKIFKEIILKSYGEKSPDGRQFVKSEELARAFSFTPAYSKLFMELASDADAASAFINGIIA